jgi:hypothetical protein
MSYVIRLGERLDGTATSIDGMYLSLAAVTADTGSPVTEHVDGAMRFRCHDDATSYLRVLAASTIRDETRLRLLTSTYGLEIVAVRPLRTMGQPAGCA